MHLIIFFFGFLLDIKCHVSSHSDDGKNNIVILIITVLVPAILVFVASLGLRYFISRRKNRTWEDKIGK